MKRVVSLALLGSAALLIPILLVRGQTPSSSYQGPINATLDASPVGCSTPACAVKINPCTPKAECYPKSECCTKSCSTKAECCARTCSSSGECCKGQCCCAKTCKNKCCAGAAARAVDIELLQQMIAILNDTESQEMVACTAAVLGRMGKDARPALPALLRSMERLGIIKDGDRKAEKLALIQQIGTAIDGILEKNGGTPLFNVAYPYYPATTYGTPVPPSPSSPLPPTPTPATPPPVPSSVTPSGPSTSAPSVGAQPSRLLTDSF